MRKKGFIALEAVVSMFILSIIVYMVSYSINSNFKAIQKNQDYINLLNTAQNSLNHTKSRLREEEDFKEGKYEARVDGFTVNTTITKNENYLDNYKVVVNVKNGNRSIKLESYVTKK